MVYKIRNKSFFWTRAGWRNNWHPKNFNSPRPSSGETTLAIRCRYDHHSFLRFCQSYRKISRHCKQYFYGDKKFEQMFQMSLRAVFLIPYTAETHTDKIKHGGERRMADQIDRDFELISYNQHPMQLFAYEVRNKQIAYETKKYEEELASQTSYEDEMLKYIDQCMEEAGAKTSDGKISLEKFTEIMNNIRQKIYQDEGNAPSLKGENGEWNDFLEQRRPFVAPNPGSATH